LEGDKFLSLFFGLSLSVMAGLVPAIHALLCDGEEHPAMSRETWMAGTSPAMTEGREK
jgi:hypothetical protein